VTVRVQWTKIASDSRRQQVAYIAELNPPAALALIRAIRAAAKGLGEHPAMGRSGRVQGTRERVLPGTPFILVYRIKADAVTILRVLHGRQKWP
jgi:toxin ParE1/3/4